jgi:hypothetical protein
VSGGGGDLLASLGATAAEMPIGLDRAMALYRSLLAWRRALVVLDNAGSAHQVRPLLAAGEGTLVVLTSRTWMPALAAGYRVERITLDVLGMDEAVALLDRVVDDDGCGPMPRRRPSSPRRAVGCCWPGASSAASLAEPGRTVAAHLAELSWDRFRAWSSTATPSSVSP